MPTPSSSPSLPPPPAPRARFAGDSGLPRDGQGAEVAAAQALTSGIAEKLRAADAFRKLPQQAQRNLLRDLDSIHATLGAGGLSKPQAAALETPEDFARRRSALRGGTEPQPAPVSSGPDSGPGPGTPPPGPKSSATQAIAGKTGALIDEVDFPAFVAGLIHGTFDAIVESAIRQMEAFAELVGAVAKNVEDFTRDNVTDNQARDWLAQRFPGDLVVQFNEETHQPVLRVRAGEDDTEAPSPAWLAEFGLEGQPLTDELVEEQLVPLARRRQGESRLQLLATMVLLGLNRVVVRDGSISARVRFRAAARDLAKVDYASSDDPGNSTSWGTPGSSAYAGHVTKVSTVSANVQSQSDLGAELFGEVKINFASETLPLERFADQARVMLLQRHSRPLTTAAAGLANAIPDHTPPSIAPVPQNPQPST